jgi:protein involved in polysaccharide export with SLBB domain
MRNPQFQFKLLRTADLSCGSSPHACHGRYRGGKPMAVGILLIFLLVCGGWGQSAGSDSRNPFAVSRSRADQQADEMVALSPDKIVDLLKQEPGLLLVAKKLLVKKAFEQGRLLDPADLTDEALFRLIRTDYHIDVLITQEVVDRGYIRPKPGQEEIQKQEALRAALGLQYIPPSPAAQVPGQPARRTGNQEDTYWSKHEDDMQRYVPRSALAPTVPSTNPNLPGSANPDAAQLQRTLKSNSIPDYGNFPNMMPGGMGGAGTMPSIAPEQLPGLLSTSASEGGGTGGEDDQGGMGGSSLLRGLTGGGAGTADYTGLASMFGGSPLGQSDPLAGATGSSGAPGVNTIAAASLPGKRPMVPEPTPAQALRRKTNPYADVPSLYDMYAQYSKTSSTLQRFGADVFLNGTGNVDELPMDLPVGPDYVVGAGDFLNIDLSGGVAERLRRTVDRQGRLSLPEVGIIPVAGHTLGEVQHLLQSTLRTQFRDVQADVSIARVRTVRVYVVGDVQRPGGYDISSLSTPLNALYTAGGPTTRGSVRIAKHYRGKQLVETVDLYDLLLHGVRSGVQRLESGDTILVPPLGAQATVEGMVRRPGIYELNGEKNLSDLLELAGGVLPSGTLRHVDVERIEAHESRSMLRLDIPEQNNDAAVNQALDGFTIQDGDRVKISPIVPYADKTVYLDGHVLRPGKYAYTENMTVTQLIQSYKDLLPEPAQKHAEVIRLQAPDFRPTVLAFNLEDVLAGKQQLVLKPYDTVRVFSRYDFEDQPVVTVSGEVRDPGDHVTNGVIHLKDAIYLAGGITPGAEVSDVQIFRQTEDRKLKVISVNLQRALDGDAREDVLLDPKDRVIVHRNSAKYDPSTVTVEGEVQRPGKYPLGQDMTATDLVRLAGGLKRSAYKEEADLTRYLVEGDSHIVGEHQRVEISRALAGESDTDVRLRDGDVLAIRQLTGWNDIGATISVKGEVLHPGSYGIREGERLSTVLERAGGLRSDAYPYGAIFERVQVREMEEESRGDLIRNVQMQTAELKLVPDSGDPDEKIARSAAAQQWQTTLDKLQNIPPSGRLVIHISSDIKKWANTRADIELRAGDSIFIPKRPNMVMITGAVYNQTAVTYRSGKSAGWYLGQAGGPTTMANKKNIFVIRADGSVISGSGNSWISGGVDSAALRPGDTVVVPERPYIPSAKWRNTLQAAQLATAVGIAIQVARQF